MERRHKSRGTARRASRSRKSPQWKGDTRGRACKSGRSHEPRLGRTRHITEHWLDTSQSTQARPSQGSELGDSLGTGFPIPPRRGERLTLHSQGDNAPHTTYPNKSDSGVTAYAITPELFAEKGGYLLSHLRSTIGTIGLNFSVRNGKRWNPNVITT